MTDSARALALSVSVSASYCIPQCVRLIAGVCTHYVVYNISKKKNTVDKSKIKDKRKVKPKDKSWVKIGWRTKNRKGWCVQKTLAWYRSPQWQCRLECIQCGALTEATASGTCHWTWQ